MVAAIGAAAAIGGSMISANATKKAANQQSASADRAAELQRESQEQMRADLAPWVNTGAGANSLLARYLGVGSPAGTSSLGITNGLSADQVRNQLLGKYTSSQNTSTPMMFTMPDGSVRSFGSPADFMNYLGSGQQVSDQMREVQNDFMTGKRSWQDPNALMTGGSQSSVDEAGLNSAVQQYMNEQSALAQGGGADTSQFGSLLRAYRDGEEFDAGPAFSFTGENLASDPGYQFGLNQGELGINRGQASRGNFLSGAAMKELARFNEDYAGTKFNDAFNRASSTYGTNLAARQNEWNTNLNAYNDNRNRIYNFLSGTSSAGQNAAAQVGNNNQQVANNVGNALMSAGNAASAGTVGTANALTNGINQAYNAYAGANTNTTQGWNSLISQGGSAYGTSGQNLSGNSLSGGYSGPAPTYLSGGGSLFTG